MDEEGFKPSDLVPYIDKFKDIIDEQTTVRGNRRLTVETTQEQKSPNDIDSQINDLENMIKKLQTEIAVMSKNADGPVLFEDIKDKAPENEHNFDPAQTIHMFPVFFEEINCFGYKNEVERTSDCDLRGESVVENLSIISEKDTEDEDINNNEKNAANSVEFLVQIEASVEPLRDPEAPEKIIIDSEKTLADGLVLSLVNGILEENIEN